mgnify:CR=1 FL=1
MLSSTFLRNFRVTGGRNGIRLAIRSGQDKRQHTGDQSDAAGRGNGIDEGMPIAIEPCVDADHPHLHFVLEATCSATIVREDRRAINAALGRLSREQRELIEAAFFLGYTQSELADEFGLPLGTVKTRIRTGLLAMRGHLQQMAG